MDLHPGYHCLAAHTMNVYPDMKEGRVMTHTQRLAAVADINELSRMRILDLGCGSVHTKDGNFPPAYARLAHEAGANVLGIDIASNNGEKFSHERRDLLQQHGLADLADESFDIVNNSSFIEPGRGRLSAGFNSPTAMHMALQKRYWLPEFFSDRATLVLSRRELRKVAHQLRQEVERLLVEGGRYSHGTHLYVKQEGRLALEHEELF